MHIFQLKILPETYILHYLLDEILVSQFHGILLDIQRNRGLQSRTWS